MSMDSHTVVLLGALFSLVMAEEFFFRGRRWKNPRKQRRRHRYWVREWLQRRQLDISNTQYKLSKELLQTNDHAEFKSMLRMDERTYLELLEKVSPLIMKQNTTFRKAISPDERLCLTLDYLANGGSNYTLSRHYRLGRSTVGKIIQSTCDAIYKTLKEDYLQTPMNAVAWRKEARLFELRWNFPNCVGAMDGKHFRIYPPQNSGSVFFNYKGSFSIILLGLCNANYELLYIDVGSEGRVADGGVWRDCDLKRAIETGQVEIPPPAPLEGFDRTFPFVIVADDAFPLSPEIMKPFAKRDLSDREEIYNYRLSRARRIAENTFGIMCNRFRVFLSNIYRTPDTVESMIMACSCLHNFLRRKCGKNYIVLTDVDHEGPDHEIIDGTWRKDNQLPRIPRGNFGNPKTYAKQVREDLADYFLSEAGSVPWQYKRL